MKRFFLFGLLSCALLGGATSCKTAVDAPADPLTLSFQLLNEQGQETSVFAPGENIIFHFEQRNTTDQTMLFLTRLADLDSTKLLAIYRGTKEQLQLVGRPYKHTSQNYAMSPYPLPAHELISFSLSWLPSAQYPDHDPFFVRAPTAWLPKGHYYATFSPSFIWYQDGGTRTETTPPPFIREFDVK